MEKKKIAIYKYLIYTAVIFIVSSFLIVMIQPVRVGDIQISRFKLTGIYHGLIKTEGDELPVEKQIKIPDYTSQIDAILEIKKGEPSFEKVQILIEYLKSERVHLDMKLHAIWALGEMKSKSALPLLISLQKESWVDRYELDKAIKKIKGEYGWIARIKQQFK